MRPRYGIIRSREFLMKDLYTFDSDKEAAMKTYELVSDTYEQIFSAIGIDYVKGYFSSVYQRSSENSSIITNIFS